MEREGEGFLMPSEKAGVAKRSTATNCKFVVYKLRRFESYLQHYGTHNVAKATD